MGLKHNIALVSTCRHMYINNDESKADWIPLEEKYTWRVGQPATITGFGSDVEDGFTTEGEHMRTTNMDIQEGSLCSSHFPDFNDKYEICARDLDVANKNDSCFSEEGAPVVVYTPQRMKLIGLVSRGEAGETCVRTGKVWSFVRISAYRPWIDAITGTSNQDSLFRTLVDGFRQVANQVSVRYVETPQTVSTEKPPGKVDEDMDSDEDEKKPNKIKRQDSSPSVTSSSTTSTTTRRPMTVTTSTMTSISTQESHVSSQETSQSKQSESIGIELLQQLFKGQERKIVKKLHVKSLKEETIDFQ